MAAVALAAGAGTIGAAPASADSTWSGTITDASSNIQSQAFRSGCDFFTSSSPIYSEQISYVPAASGPVTLTVTSATIGGVSPPAAFAVGVFFLNLTPVRCVASSEGNLTLPSLTVDLTAAPDTGYIFVVWGSSLVPPDADGSVTTGTFSISIDILGDGTPSSASAVPAWVQAYGRFGEDAACEDGWDASWQEWAEPLTGGWVCTRSIPSLG